VLRPERPADMLRAGGADCGSHSYPIRTCRHGHNGAARHRPHVAHDGPPRRPAVAPRRSYTAQPQAVNKLNVCRSGASAINRRWGRIGDAEPCLHTAAPACPRGGCKQSPHMCMRCARTLPLAGVYILTSRMHTAQACTTSQHARSLGHSQKHHDTSQRLRHNYDACAIRDV